MTDVQRRKEKSKAHFDEEKRAYDLLSKFVKESGITMVLKEDLTFVAEERMNTKDAHAQLSLEMPSRLNVDDGATLNFDIQSLHTNGTRLDISVCYHMINRNGAPGWYLFNLKQPGYRGPQPIIPALVGRPDEIVSEEVALDAARILIAYYLSLPLVT